jgi:hypothetical protein
LIGLTIDLISAFWLFEAAAAAGKPIGWRSSALLVWLCVFAVSATHPQRHLGDLIELRREIGEAGAKNVRAYLATGDGTFLGGTPAEDIPYFDGIRLRQLLDVPEIRSMLPPDLSSRKPPRQWLETLKRGFVHLGLLWAGLGVILLVTVLVLRAPTPAALALWARPNDST